MHRSETGQDVRADDPVLVLLTSRLVGLPDRDGTATADPLKHDFVAAALAAYLATTYGAGASDVRQRGALSPLQVQRAKDMLDAAIETGITINDLAAACGGSRTSFGKAFLRATGLSPHRWLRARRIERARDLLAATDAPISDIALACGFADQSQLTRAFTQATGEPPGAFRRRSATTRRGPPRRARAGS